MWILRPEGRLSVLCQALLPTEPPRRLFCVCDRVSAMYPRLVSNSKQFFYFLIAGIAGIDQQTQPEEAIFEEALRVRKRDPCREE